MMRSRAVTDTGHDLDEEHFENRLRWEEKALDQGAWIWAHFVGLVNLVL